MNQQIVQSDTGITIIGAGDCATADLAAAISVAPILVAADGGAKTALAAGYPPDAVIGDFDSIGDDERRRVKGDRLHRIDDQNTTDFEKCLARVSAPLIVAVGVLGPRMDHGLAALSALVANADRRIILLSDSDVCFHTPANLSVDLPKGARISLFPMEAVRASSVGLDWPLDGLILKPGAQTSTSNAASGGLVSLTVDGPGLIAIVAKAHLEAVVHSFQR